MNAKQYNIICKYWKIIEKYKRQIENRRYAYKDYSEYSDDEDYITECIEHNACVDNYYDILKGRLHYYEQGYANYVNKIGYKFNDQSQTEQLFNLLNNGIIMIINNVMDNK
jgi:hypothetical protein